MMSNNDHAAVPKTRPQLDGWIEERYQERLGFGLRAGKTLHRSQSKFQKIEIVETEFGETLILDGAMMTAAAIEHYYHEMLVHPALANTPYIADVLVIGGGDGGTVREVLRYPEVESVTLVELDEGVIRACQEHLTSMRVPWDDPRLTISCGDGAAYVKNCAPGRHNVILVDGADPVGEAAVLFSHGFYQDCKRAMTEDGVLASQTESPIAMREDFLRIVRTMRHTFGEVRPCFGPMPIYPGGTWSWTYASNEGDPTWFHDFFETRAKRIEKTSAYYTRDIHRAAFAIPNDLKRELR